MAQSVPLTEESDTSRPWTGRSIERVEDAALLSGRGRFIDDLATRTGTLHAAILRSPHAHADIVAIDVAAAKQVKGVVAVLTVEDIKEVLIHATAYCGIPAGLDAFKAANETLKEMGKVK